MQGTVIENPIPWPDGNRCAVAISWDVDVDSGLNYLHPNIAATLVATHSLLSYEIRISIPRLMNVLGHLGLKQTFFVPGWVIERYPSLVRTLLENGHEIGLHGYVHERSNELTKQEEADVLGFALEAYRKEVGCTPRGWRAPSFAFSRHSLDLLVDAGFEYDSSLMGDDIPYIIKNPKSDKEILELSTDWSHDDWPHYMFNRDFNFTMPVSAPKRAMEVFGAEFDAAWRYGSLWVTVWHPFLSGRLARLHAAVELIEKMQERGGVWLTRLDAVCDHVNRLRADGKWTPSKYTTPEYECPIAELLPRIRSA